MVVRDGHRSAAPAAGLVPGDVIILEEGDHVPADGRLLDAFDLGVDESALTGESVMVGKKSTPLLEEVILAERRNMAYMGTVVLRGRGRLVVTETGMNTEVGRIAEAVQSQVVRPTQFQRDVSTLGKRITVIIGVIIGVVSALLLTVGDFDVLETFVAAVALAVAAIPEGLPVVLTLALAFGTRRMLERHALVRSLPVLEILGSSQVICTDKTGTITEGRMSLRVLHWQGRQYDVTGAAASTDGEYLDDGKPVDLGDNLAVLAGGLCNNAEYHLEHGFMGDPTEVALLAAAHKAGVPLSAYVREDEVPFSSERKMMSVVASSDGRRYLFSKGASEVVVQKCTHVLTGDGPGPMTSVEREALLQENARLAGQSLRVLALAYKEDPDGGHEALEQDLVFLGLAGIADPPRPEAKAAMEAASAAGIRVVMITGDNKATALAIANDVGMRGECLEGREVEGMDDATLSAAVQQGDIYARAEPTHKLRILQALQGADRVVAMTGDGVNDAPALKGSDVGIAMGVRGTDVARDAADMVLMDDNFASIVSAVEEGRRIFANIKKFVAYLLTANLSEVLVILVASIFGYLPITAVQILWINLVTDSAPAVALGVDPAPRGLMHEPPHRGQVISRPVISLILAVGAVIAVIILGIFALMLEIEDLPTARTVAFTAFVVLENLPLVAIRIQERSSLLANRWLIVAILVSFGLQLIVLYTAVGSLFDVVPLGLQEWLVLLGGVALGIVGTILVSKVLTRRVGPI
jgi:P-type Ca2+ transporter type 2C